MQGYIQPDIDSLRAAFLGKQLKIDVIKRNVVLLGIDTPVLSYILPNLPEIQAEVKRISKTEKIRIILPNAIITQDIRSDRVNIKVDKEGVVKDVHIG